MVVLKQATTLTTIHTTHQSQREGEVRQASTPSPAVLLITTASLAIVQKSSRKQTVKPMNSVIPRMVKLNAILVPNSEDIANHVPRMADAKTVALTTGLLPVSASRASGDYDLTLLNYYDLLKI